MNGTESLCSDCCKLAADAMDSAAWTMPTLSLPSQFEMERDRRAAAHMRRDQLAVKVDELIQSWYQQQTMIESLLKKVGHLQAEMALGDSLQFAPPTDQHYQWAREVLGR
jgi:hypothetical protein